MFSRRVYALAGFFLMIVTLAGLYAWNMFSWSNKHLLNHGPPELITGKQFIDSWWDIIAQETRRINDRIQFERARSSNDEKQCSKVQDDFVRDQCKSIIIATKIGNSNDLKVCNLYEDTTEKNRCQTEISLRLATSQGGIKYCRDIEDEITRQICLSRVAIVHAEQGDAKMCQSDDMVCQQAAKRVQRIQDRNIDECWNHWLMEFQMCVQDMIAGILKKDGDGHWCETIKEKSPTLYLSCREQSLQIVNNLRLESNLRKAIGSKDPQFCASDLWTQAECAKRYKSIEAIISH